MLRKPAIKVAALVWSASLFTGSAQAESIYNEIKAKPEFSTLTSLLDATALSLKLADDNQSLTLFAPTNDAFGQINDVTISTLAADLVALKEVLHYHLLGSAVPGSAAFEAARNNRRVASLSGENLQLSFGGVTGTDLLINESRVSTTDVILRDTGSPASNGVVHAIDKLLVPDTRVATFMAERCTRTLTIDDVDTNISGFEKTRVCVGKIMVDGSQGIAIFSTFSNGFARTQVFNIDFDLIDDPNLLPLAGRFVESNNAFAPQETGRRVQVAVRAEAGEIVEIGYNESSFVGDDDLGTFELTELRQRRARSTDILERLEDE